MDPMNLMIAVIVSILTLVLGVTILKVCCKGIINLVVCCQECSDEDIESCHRDFSSADSGRSLLRSEQSSDSITSKYGEQKYDCASGELSEPPPAYGSAEGSYRTGAYGVQPESTKPQSQVGGGRKFNSFAEYQPLTLLTAQNRQYWEFPGDSTTDLPPPAYSDIYSPPSMLLIYKVAAVGPSSRRPS